MVVPLQGLLLASLCFSAVLFVAGAVSVAAQVGGIAGWLAQHACEESVLRVLALLACLLLIPPDT